MGFLFAFNAMLLTVPQRRRLVADLRRDGYTPATVIAVLLLDALALGLIGCALGLALGEELSIHLFHSNPAFLSLAFAVGSQRVVSWQSVAIAAGGGMLAATVAVLSPLRDILSRDPLAAISPREGSSGTRTGRRRALAGLACLAAATALLLAKPDAAIPGMVLLLGALLLELPIVLSATLVVVKRIGSLFVSPIPHVAAMELGAARARAVAIAATGAVAVFGSVAIQGAHGDLLRGLEGAARDTNAATDVWVSPAGSYNLLQHHTLHSNRGRPTCAAARSASGAAVPRRPARLRLPPRARRRAAARSHTADTGRPDSAGQRCAWPKSGYARVAGRSSRKVSPKNSTCTSARSSLRRHPTRCACAWRRCPPTSAGRPGRCSSTRPTTRARGEARTQALTACC